MKIKLLLFAVFIILFHIAGLTVVIAGDLPESALQYSDFCFIGIVEKVDNTSTKIKISQVLFGDFKEDTVDILDLKYTTTLYKTSLPKKGDYCAVVVKKESDGYRVYGGLAAKATSLDKKTLKLKSSQEFLIRMNKYINNGWYSNDTIEMINQRIAKSHASSSATNTPSVGSPTVIPTVTAVKDTTLPQTNTSGKPVYYFYAAASIILLAGAIFIGFRMKKYRKSK